MWKRRLLVASIMLVRSVCGFRQRGFQRLRAQTKTFSLGDDSLWQPLKQAARVALGFENGTEAPRDFKVLNNRRSWILYPASSAPVTWLLMVNKKSSFTVADAAAVLQLHSELRAADYDNAANSFSMNRQHSDELNAEPAPATEKMLGDIRMARRPAPLLVVVNASIDYRAAAQIRSVGLEIWPKHRLAEVLGVDRRGSGRSKKYAVPATGLPPYGNSLLLPVAAPSSLSPRPMEPPSETDADHSTADSSPAVNLAATSSGNPLGRFELRAPYVPTGDQPAAIAALCNGLTSGRRFQTLMGATGTVR
jgi:hypothetical protein